ncbi:adhesion G-protein coupled receptor G2 [Clinocottus analis]|uniref:adhesion G-protein coupled receptor G2 n=1 Tax=Clinocottus analis TaxID=304258 RepID=UPI0035C0BD92
MSASVCRDILRRYKHVHLECHGTQPRLYSCMVILEMSGPVNGCALKRLLQQVIDGYSSITNERPLTRMVVCGPPGLAVSTLLASNLTWVASDLQISDVCQPEPTRLNCEANENRAVLLTDSCPMEPLTTTQNPTKPYTLTDSNVTTTPGAFTPSVANTTQRTAKGSAKIQTIPLETMNSTESLIPLRVLKRSSQDITVIASSNITVQNTTLLNNTMLKLTVNTTLQNTTTGQRNASSVNTTIQNIINDSIGSTVNTITLSPNQTTEYNVTTVTPSVTSNNHTTTFNITTATPSNNHTTTFNVTTATPSNNHTTTFNHNNIQCNDNHTFKQHNNIQCNYTFKQSHNNNQCNYNYTDKQSHNNIQCNYNYTFKTINITTPSNNHTTTFNVTTVTPSNNHTTFNITTTTPSNHNTTFNSTPSNNLTTTVNITTTTPTTTFNVTTAPPSNNHTTTFNVTTTTPLNNHTTTFNVTTATPSNNHTTASTTNTTVDDVTSVVNVTKPTEAPLNNQTGNHTTASHHITTTSKNDTFTTASTVVNTTINLSSTASSSTTHFNLTTTAPGVNLTSTTANTSVEATTSSTTSSSTVPAQINTTTSEVPLTSSPTTVQTSPPTNTTTTEPATAETTTTQQAQVEEANQLLNQTQDASQLNSSQVSQLVGDLEKLLDGPTVSQALGQKAVNVISNLMEGDAVALSESSNRLIRLVDNLGLKLVVNGDNEIISSDSLVLAVREVDGTNFPVTSVDILNTDNVQIRSLGRSRSKRSGSALGSVFLPSSLTNGLSLEQQQEANRVQFTFYTKSAFFQDAALDNNTLVSPVLAASVSNLSISNLEENIQFTIRNIDPIHENYTASCAFWVTNQNGGGGRWSSAGCFVVKTTTEETTCSCNHLTSFAILLDLSRDVTIDRQHAQILTFITYIGCGISVFFLALTLMTYLLFPKLLRDIPAKILVQLCLSLLLLNLVFLLDGWLALYPAIGLCISTAFFLHYFLLTSFTWAGLEALHMYLSIVRVFTPYLSRYMLKFSLMGWGIPLLVVIVVIAVDKDNYGLVTYGKYTDGTSDDFCWLRNDIAFYVAVVAYFLLMFGLCLLVFIVVMIQLSRIKKQNPQNQPPNRSVMTDLRSIAGLVVLLGLTWGFALFAWGPLYLPFVYLFTIFNSLQGFLVFVLHCAVKESVRRQWRTYLCCGRLRLAENSDWSRTATQNNRGVSVTTAITTAPPLTSRSTSVISDATSGSDSVFMDSGISDGSNSDVLLNESHRRDLSL